MAIVANVDADACMLGCKDRIAKIAGSKVKLLPKSGMAVRDVVLAVFSQVAAVSIDHSGGVEINAVEEFLQTKDLRFFPRRLFDQFQVLVDHRFSDLGKGALRAERIAGLNQGTAHNSRHETRTSEKRNYSRKPWQAGLLPYNLPYKARRCRGSTRSVSVLRTGRT